MPPQQPANPAARWRLQSLPGSPVAQANVPVTYLPHRKPGRHNPNVPDIIPENLPRMTSWPDFPFIHADAGLDNCIPPPGHFDVRGKIGQTVYQKTYRILPDGTQSPTPELQRRRMVIPTDPRTTAQLQLRARFGRAVQNWKALTDEERQDYNAAAAAMHPWYEGLNLWIRDYCRAHAPAEFAEDAEYLRTHGSLPPLE